MAAVVDTNVLVYRHDPRYPAKQAAAEHLLRDGAATGSVSLPNQVLVEFVSVVGRRVRGAPPLWERAEAAREVEILLGAFDVLYPTAEVIRLALRGADVYQLSWYDARLWAYAEHYGLDTL